MEVFYTGESYTWTKRTRNIAEQIIIGRFPTVSFCEEGLPYLLTSMSSPLLWCAWLV